MEKGNRIFEKARTLSIPTIHCQYETFQFKGLKMNFIQK